MRQAIDQASAARPQPQAEAWAVATGMILAVSGTGIGRGKQAGSAHSPRPARGPQCPDQTRLIIMIVD